MQERSIIWLRTGLVWLFLTMAAGFEMAFAGEFGAASHHAHMGLLGGLWSIAFGFLFARKRLAMTVMAWLQWAVYHLGVATMAVGMYMVLRHGGTWGMVIGIGGIAVMIATLWIIIQAWPRNA